MVTLATTYICTYGQYFIKQPLSINIASWTTSEETEVAEMALEEVVTSTDM